MTIGHESVAQRHLFHFRRLLLLRIITLLLLLLQYPLLLLRFVFVGVGVSFGGGAVIGRRWKR